jgi:hypothetical protein
MAITDSTAFAKYLPTHSYTNDQVTAAIAAANQIVETYCNRTFDSDTYTEWHYIDGESRIFLEQYPVTAITSIDTADEEDGTETDYTDDYRIKRPSGVMILPTELTTWFKVVYTAGYSTIPADVILCANEVAKCILDGGAKDKAVTEEKIADYSYKVASAADTDPILAILSRVNAYRKQVI